MGDTPSRHTSSAPWPSPEAIDNEITAGPGTVTTIRGLTFVVSDEIGNVHRGVTGLITNDRRHLSVLALTVDGSALERLGAATLSPDAASFHSFRSVGDHPDPALECIRTRQTAPGGFAETIVLQWWAGGQATFDVGLEVACDFADIFAVRRPASDVSDRDVQVEWLDGALRLRDTSDSATTEVHLSEAPGWRHGGRLRWTVTLDRERPWSLEIAVTTTPAPQTEHHLGERTRRAGSMVQSEPGDLQRACDRALQDFERLSIRDVRQPERRMLAAGIPWFVALFGRDSLIAAYQARIFAPELLPDTLLALADRQGSRSDPANDEEPGKILHEVRLTPHAWLGSGTEDGVRPYYGSIDATPLFVMMVGVAWRWGAPRDVIARLLPAAYDAIEWMRTHGDRDGDGLIEYVPGGSRSLRNQGWKDSENAVQFSDGTLATGPIAMVEVQGYAYRARRELADLCRAMGDHTRAEHLSIEADVLRRTIRERYWISGRGRRPGYFALALDGDKRPVDAVASNMGHLLWCGVPSNEEAEQVARHLIGPELWSGWGVRTLSTTMAGYNPISYHVGSVWPHDTALICEGLRRYALDDEAMHVADSLIAAMNAFGGRLPELFGGHDRTHHPLPVPYPTACRPQAWSAGVPLSLIPTLLGLDPAASRGALTLSPRLPASVRRLSVTGIRAGDRHAERLSIEVGPDGTRLAELPANTAVALRPSGHRRTTG